MIRLTAICLLMLLAACFNYPVHQGNIIKQEQLVQIRVGDSRYYVERILGAPVLKDVLHPRRATYIEHRVDDDEDIEYQHRVEIEYSDSDEVVSIEKLGFDQGEPTK